MGSQAGINIEVQEDASRPSSQIKGTIVNQLIKHSKQRPLQSQAEIQSNQLLVDHVAGSTDQEMLDLASGDDESKDED